jgi:hypothetical protein
MSLRIPVRVAAVLAAAAALASPARALAVQDFERSTIATPADLARIAYGRSDLRLDGGDAAGALRPGGAVVAVVVQKRRRHLRSAAVRTAAAHPRVRAESPVVSAGDRYALVGSGWNLPGRCGRLVAVGETLGRRLRIRSAPVARDGSFAFSRRVPDATPAGTRIVVDVTRYCRPHGSDRLRTVVRSATIRVARAPYACAEPLTAAGGRYELTVAGRMRCADGAAAVAAFLASGSEPDGFLCGRNADYAGGGADCLRADDPASRVEARPL